MTKVALVRTVSAVAALGTARAALADVAAATEPTFAITPGGWWSLLGTAVFTTALVWVMRKFAS